MEQRLSALTLGVKQLLRSKEFYVDGLGFQPVHDSPDQLFFQAAGIVLSLLQLDDLERELGIPASKAGFGNVIMGYAARTPADVDRILNQALNAGGQLVKKPCETSWGGYAAYFSDPDGHVWEIAWTPGWKISTEGFVQYGD